MKPLYDGWNKNPHGDKSLLLNKLCVDLFKFYPANFQ